MIRFVMLMTRNFLEKKQKFKTFFFNSFNIKKLLMLADPAFSETHLQSPDFIEDGIDTERKYENTKFTKLMAQCQFTYYIFHSGKRKTPLHLMTVHAIWEKSESSKLITTFNHIEVYGNYREAQKTKSNLGQYTLMQSE